MSKRTPALPFIAEPLRHLAVGLELLTPDPSNARKHDQRNLEAITASYRTFGQRKPIVVQKQGMVVRAGNGQLAAAQALGWTHIAAVVVDEDATTATAYAIADNRTAELAEWDGETLAALMNSLPDELQTAAGFTDAELKGLLADLQPELIEDSAPAPAPHAVARPGEIWNLGRHRLMCGSSTVPADVARLMDGEQARLCSTDPPYLVDYTGERPEKQKNKWKDQNWDKTKRAGGGKDWSATYREVDIPDAESFYRDLFTNVLEHLAPHSAIYCWHAHRRVGVIQAVWEALDILDHQQIIWVKPCSVLGRVFWHFRHEPCMMGWKRGSMPKHDGQSYGSVWTEPGPAPALEEMTKPQLLKLVHAMSDVWELGWEAALAGGPERKKIVGNEHPTQKPVEIFARPIRKHTTKGDIVLEPFSGSGSQLSAAEQTGRTCYAMELEPVFVDVAIRRWQALTGLEATLSATGATWAETARTRKVKIDAQETTQTEDASETGTEQAGTGETGTGPNAPRSRRKAPATR